MRRRRSQRRPGVSAPVPFSPLVPVRRRRRRRAARTPGAIVLGAAAVVGLGAWQLPERLGNDTAVEGAGAGVTTQPEKPRAPAPPPAAGPGTPKPVSAQPALLEGRRLGVRLRPSIRAKGAILIEARSGRVLYGRYPHRRLPIASTTKIMTALLAIEHLRPERRVTILPKVARVQPFREGLRPGERPPVWKLLYGLMLYSGNDDALALAHATSGTRKGFLALMNRRAKELGLVNTHFASPSGVIDEGNYSTASDLAALSRYAMRNPRFRELVRTRIKRVRWAAPTFAKIYVNKNPLLATYRGADGIKTGWTSKAGSCLVASARRGNTRLIAVVLGARGSAAVEARRLLNHGFEHAGDRSPP